MGFCRRRSRVPRLQLYADDTICIYYTIYNCTTSQPSYQWTVTYNQLQCNAINYLATQLTAICTSPQSNIPSELHRNANSLQPNSSYLSCTLTTTHCTVHYRTQYTSTSTTVGCPWQIVLLCLCSCLCLSTLVLLYYCRLSSMERSDSGVVAAPCSNCDYRANIAESHQQYFCVYIYTTVCVFCVYVFLCESCVCVYCCFNWIITRTPVAGLTTVIS